jgi:hypothetical protein
VSGQAQKTVDIVPIAAMCAQVKPQVAIGHCHINHVYIGAITANTKGIYTFNAIERIIGVENAQAAQPGRIPIQRDKGRIGSWICCTLAFGGEQHCPSAREGSTFTVLVLLPLMIPLLFSSSLVHSPNGLVAMALSLFPFTSPSAMITRLVAIQVPIWQTLVSLAGLIIATGFCVGLSARFFRADTLLSHSTMNWQRILIALQRKRVDS